MLRNIDQGILRLSGSEDEGLQIFYSDTALGCYSLMGLIGVFDLGHT